MLGSRRPTRTRFAHRGQRRLGCPGERGGRHGGPTRRSPSRSPHQRVHRRRRHPVPLGATHIEISSIVPAEWCIPPTVPTTFPAWFTATSVSATLSKRVRHRSSRSFEPCQSASFDPNASGASASERSRTSRHTAQSSASSVRISTNGIVRAWHTNCERDFAEPNATLGATVVRGREPRARGAATVGGQLEHDGGNRGWPESGVLPFGRT